MPRERTCSKWILIAALVGLAPWAHADEPEAHKGAPARHDRPPRKVIVGTTMTRWYSDYPGLDGRLGQMSELIDQMVAESRTKYGRSIDLALFTEYAVTAGKPGPAAKVAVPLDDTITKALGSLPDVKTEMFVPEIANAVPHLRVTWDYQMRGVSVSQMVKKLREGSPSIEVSPGSRRQLSIGVWMMEPGEDAIVGERMRAILAST